MIKQNESGFTVIEFLIILALVGIFAVGCLAEYNEAIDKAREEEVKKNIHTIQVALERYASDHGGQYPKMIWGGDERGWSTVRDVGCRTMWQHEPFDGTNEDTAHPPIDPLISLGYMSSYPQNPFLELDEDLSRFIQWTSPKLPRLGDGDPRFGYQGNTMGNIIEDPRYLWSGPNQLTRIKNCFLPEAKNNNIAMVHEKNKVNPFYAKGGIPRSERQPFATTVSTFWPGTFFYRSGGTLLVPENFLRRNLPDPQLTTIWDFSYSRINRYMIVGFGSPRTDGMDVIRNTNIDGKVINNMEGYTEDATYRSHPNYPHTLQSRIFFSSPEVCGGGEKGTMPYFPYIDPKSGEWIFGAPDGYRDGVIIVLIGGGG